MVRVRRICRHCGGPIPWQRHWSNAAHDRGLCSDGCRERSQAPKDRRIRSAILELLGRRAVGASVCPSEVARALAPSGDWRALMEPVRLAARDLRRDGLIEITQKGRPVSLNKTRGPVRLRLKPKGAIQA